VCRRRRMTRNRRALPPSTKSKLRSVSRRGTVNVSG
jgi:hypothetical protein